MKLVKFNSKNYYNKLIVLLILFVVSIIVSFIVGRYYISLPNLISALLGRPITQITS